MIVSVDAALKDHRVYGPIKEAPPNTKRTDWIIRGQRIADLLCLGFHRRFLRLYPMI